MLKAIFVSSWPLVSISYLSLLERCERMPGYFFRIYTSISSVISAGLLIGSAGLRQLRESAAAAALPSWTYRTPTCRHAAIPAVGDGRHSSKAVRGADSCSKLQYYRVLLPSSINEIKIQWWDTESHK